jgi:hypothetical protein
MTAQYTVVRYVPNPIAEECVNVGVITWDQNRIRSRFLENWTRVKTFGNENIDFLRDFAKEISVATNRQMNFPGINTPQSLNVETIEKMINSWGQSIQLSSPRGSTKDPDALLADIAPLFLAQQRRRRTRVRSRTTAARHAATILIDVRRRIPDQAEQLVKTRQVFDGAVEQHRLDVALANGHLLAGVQAISFEINPGEHLEKEILLTKWTLADIRQRYDTVPIAVFAYPPTRANARPAYNGARRVFDALGAEIVTTPEGMAQWADDRVRAIRPRRRQ